MRRLDQHQNEPERPAPYLAGTRSNPLIIDSPTNNHPAPITIRRSLNSTEARSDGNLAQERLSTSATRPHRLVPNTHDTIAAPPAGSGGRDVERVIYTGGSDPHVLPREVYQRPGSRVTITPPVQQAHRSFPRAFSPERPCRECGTLLPRHEMGDHLIAHQLSHQNTHEAVDAIDMITHGREAESRPLVMRHRHGTGSPLHTTQGLLVADVFWSLAQLQGGEGIHSRVLRFLGESQQEDYDDLYEIHRRLNPPDTVTQEELSSLPTGMHASHNQHEDNRRCLICMDDFVCNEKLRFLPCLHRFHIPCIDKWLRESSTLCPICKADVKEALNRTGSQR